jgi:hypothetical protein
MRINVKKSKVTVITKTKNREHLNITWEEEQLEQVERFEYLGTVVIADGKTEEEIKHRVQKANQIYYQLENTIVGNKELKEDTKMRICKTVFIPTLLYGTESVTILDQHKNRMQTSEMKYLRKVVGKSRRDQIKTTKIRNQSKNQ